MLKRFLTLLCCACILLTVAGCGSQDTFSAIDLENLFEDVTLSENFKIICQTVGMNPYEILDMEQIDDWTGGPRYSFVYHKAPFRLYCNLDSTIESLKLGADTDIFKNGFEPYQVSDFIASEEEKLQLQIAGEDTVKNFLNYPETADFHMMDWGYGKDHDLQHVSGQVTAKNAFGVSEDIYFSVIYHVEGTHYTPIYVSLNEEIQLDERSQYSRPERAAANIDPQTHKEDGSVSGIILEDGKLGKYGKEDIVNGETSIDFFVPVGTYEAKNLSNLCTLFIIDNMTNEPVFTVEFSEPNASEKITVSENEHLELTIYGKVSLTPVK